MKVFVTGSTGFIGSAIVRELIGAGHEVLGLARSDAAAESLIAAGAAVHRGSLDDLDSLRSGAAAADGVIHAAFVHDFSDYEGACEKDRRAIEAMGAVLSGSNRPFIITSGMAGRTEEEAGDPSTTGPRAASEQVALSFASKGVRVSVLRLPPSVHGEGDHGFVRSFINIAHEKGVSAYVGDGSNRWPSVHRFDAAHLFRLALEKAPAGSRFHAVADEGVSICDIAGVIGRHLNLPVVSISAEEAANHFGWLGWIASKDIPASSTLTRERLGWQPVQPTLIQDMDEQYFTI